MPDSMIHIEIEAIENGETWSCYENGCGVQLSPNFPYNNAQVGKLVNGKFLEHDFIYFVEKFTASAPKYEK